MVRIFSTKGGIISAKSTPAKLKEEPAPNPMELLLHARELVTGGNIHPIRKKVEEEAQKDEIEIENKLRKRKPIKPIVLSLH